MTKDADLIIIGGGPGGYVAAIRAAQLNMKVILIEKEHLGGICLNWGCIPTKALLRSAEISHLLGNLDEFGFSADNIKFDLNKIVTRSRNISKRLASGVAHLMKKNKIQVIDGHGSIINSEKIQVTDNNGKITNLSCKYIIIATGARARELPNIKINKNNIVTYKEAMLPNKIPKKLLVVGSGAIGIEFASFYLNMGSEVTILEAQNRILTAEDAEISEMAKKIFEKQGMKIITNANIKEIISDKDFTKVTVNGQFGSETEMKFDHAVIAVGIKANIENIGLENTKIITENNHIVTDKYMMTKEKNIYAIGDVTGSPWLAHKASHEGIIAVESIAGLKVKPLSKDKIPGCTYCRPQIASVGYTEQQAKDKGYKIKVGRFPYMANGKALSLGEEEGLIKTIFDEKTGEILGAHMIGSEVTELIHGIVTAKNLEATEIDIMHSIYPHPTLSETLHESTLNAFSKTIHF